MIRSCFALFIETEKFAVCSQTVSHTESSFLWSAKRCMSTRFFTARDTIAAGRNDCNRLLMLCVSSTTQLSTINVSLLGVFYQSDRPTKNTLEKKWIESSREKT